MKKQPKDKLPNFRSLIETLARNHDAYKVFSSFCTLSACALASQTREAEYLDEVKRWKRDEIEIFTQAFAALILEMEEHPFTDILGGFYMDFAISHKSAQWGGEFHTPQPICELMARLVTANENIPKDGPISLCEPACGAGAMILAFAHSLKPQDIRRLKVTAIDLSKTACDMCFINTTLWGISTEIIHGNTITEQYFAGWKNIHWIMRGCLHLFMSPMKAPSEQPTISSTALFATIQAEVAAEQGQPPTPETTAKIHASKQQEFKFL